jgi:hypothetical protein
MTWPRIENATSERRCGAAQRARCRGTGMEMGFLRTSARSIRRSGSGECETEIENATREARRDEMGGLEGTGMEMDGFGNAFRCCDRRCFSLVPPASYSSSFAPTRPTTPNKNRSPGRTSIPTASPAARTPPTNDRRRRTRNSRGTGCRSW